MPTTPEQLDLLTKTVGDLVQEVLVTKESLDAAKTSAEEDAAFADQRATFADQRATAADISATTAQAAAVTASLLYDSEPNGRAASINGQVFRVAVTPGVQAWRRDSASASTFLGWVGEVIFDDVASLLASTFMGFATGQVIRTRFEGFSYTVAVSGASNHHVTTAGDVKLYAAPNSNSSFSDTQFGAVAGADCTAAFQRAAAVLPAQTTFRVSPGVKLISSGVIFSQNGLTLVGQPGSIIKQASSTPTMDTLVTMSGTGVKVLGLTFDANLVGNPTVSYTGRGELLRLSGADAYVNDVQINGSHVKEYSCGLYLLGARPFVENVKGDETGRVMIRGRHDRAILRNISGRNVQASTGGIGNKIIAWDGGNGDADGPFTTLIFDGIIGQSDDTSFHELIVVDDSLFASGLVIAKNLVADYPNSTGPDVIKFVNCDVQIDGLRTTHTGDASSNASLRFQWSVSAPGRIRRISVKGLDLAGHINFDDTQPAYLTIAGDCLIGRSLSGPVCVDDQPDGEVTVSDGATLQNFTASAIATRSDAFDASQNIGAVNLVGASGGTPSSRRVVNHRAYLTGTPTRRLSAGQVRIKEPLTVSGTRVPADGRWVLDSDTLDASVIQGPLGEFMVSGTDFALIGPRDTDGWRRGMKIVRRDPSSGQVSTYRCVTSGSSCQATWVASTAYTVGARRFNGTNVYVCVTAGTSNSSGGPTGTGTSITDGTAVWDYVATLAVWVFDGQIDIPRLSASQYSSASAGINTSFKFQGKIAWDTTNSRLLIASGSADTDSWVVVDGSATVTPA